MQTTETSLGTAQAWFKRFCTARNIHNPHLQEAAMPLLGMLDKNSGKTPHNYTMCILPVLDYLYQKHTGQAIDFNSLAAGTFLQDQTERITHLITTYGNQATIPQRALALLSYLERQGIQRCTVIEIGASAGVLGAVLEHYPRIHLRDHGKYFSGSLKPQKCQIDYKGFDLVQPNLEMLPYFLHNPSHRQNLRNVMEYLRLPTISTADGLEYARNHANTRTIILTSFMMYQLPDPASFQNEILGICDDTHATWIDMSRYTEATSSLFSGQDVTLGYCYLRKNGKAIAQSIQGSDDMPNLIWL